MSSSKLPNLASLRAHQLRLEFASLQVAPPPGIYVSISPTDPTLWSGVLFVQEGPYASAILRFQIRFPRTYPALPPTVTFSTDIFHPLLVPSTTYTFTTGSSSDTDTVSATDDERLSPGGFSLRHGFPHWFGRARRSAANSTASSRNVSGNHPAGPSVETGARSGEGRKSSDDQKDGEQDTSKPQELERRGTEDGNDVRNVKVSPFPSGTVQSYSSGLVDVPVLEILNYIRSTFDNESILDSVPLEAAGNPGAWHAWRAYRRNTLSKPSNDSKASEDSPANVAGRTLSPDGGAKKGGPQARSPGEWNWEGVWVKRVQDGIRNSYLESVLFGTSKPVNPSDDPIRFQKLDSDILTQTKEVILATREKVDA